MAVLDLRIACPGTRQPRLGDINTFYSVKVDPLGKPMAKVPIAAPNVQYGRYDPPREDGPGSQTTLRLGRIVVGAEVDDLGLLLIVCIPINVHLVVRSPLFCATLFSHSPSGALAVCYGVVYSVTVLARRGRT